MDETKNANIETQDEEQKNTEQKETAPKEEKQPELKYSDKDLDAIIDKKFKAWKEKEAKAVKEAERLAKMTAEEKAEEEKQAAIRRAEEAEAKLERLGLMKTARDILAESKINLNDELLETLVAQDAETTKNNISNFTKLFNQAVEDAVKSRIAGTPPKTGGKAKMTKAEIMAIKDTAERHQKIRENMELFTK